MKHRCPKGHVTAYVLAKRLNISPDTVRFAIRDGRLDGQIINGRFYVLDKPADLLTEAFPVAFPRSQRKLMDRWLNVHDIRGIGERAVRQTA